MARILTFLGKGGSGRTTIAIAAAHKLALQGSRVLFVGQGVDPTWSKALGITPNLEPQAIEPNLKVVQLAATLLLEKAWDELKALEKQYLRSPILNNVYGQELGILPGMDEALALNALREYDASGDYDIIIYDGIDSFHTIRMFAIPEILSWYFRRFRKLITESDLGKALSPFIQPITATILNVSWSFDNFAPEPNNRANQILTDGMAALADPQRISAYLVIDSQPEAIDRAQSLWGSAQQVGLTVAGVLLNQRGITPEIQELFEPLSFTDIPHTNTNDLTVISDALPDLQTTRHAPLPVKIDINAKEVRVFLPGFNKKQVKLSQSGPEITIDAGDQRHNLLLPTPLAGKPVKGAKFEHNYLVISL
ncbi:MAG: ArsA family ATPase [Gloeocapsa sp. DLM2.Bin57]|nr:MAG: ArsA family ATPase [Gloeocapsa sp. DLM2.Bin57]